MLFDVGTDLIVRIDVRRGQRRRELPQWLLAEGKGLRLRRRRGLKNFSRVHRSGMLLPLAQLAVDDANRHHSTVVSNHGSKRSVNARITVHTGFDHR